LPGTGGLGLNNTAQNALVCQLTNNTGTIENNNITGAAGPQITCNPIYSVTVNFVTYTGTGLQIFDTWSTDGLPGVQEPFGPENYPGAPGGFTFPTYQPAGSTYSISVPVYASLNSGQTTGPIENCKFTSGGTVSNGGYTVGGTITSNVTVVLTCTQQPLNTIRVRVTGLASENSITLQDSYSNNTANLQTDTLTLTGAANQNTFANFPDTVATGQQYTVTVLDSAINPIQTCTLGGNTTSPAMPTGTVSLTLTCTAPLADGTSCTSNNQCGSLNCQGAPVNLCEPNTGSGAGTPCDGANPGACNTGACVTAPATATDLYTCN
jgi:hypothetical protein